MFGQPDGPGGRASQPTPPPPPPFLPAPLRGRPTTCPRRPLALGAGKEQGQVAAGRRADPGLGMGTPPPHGILAVGLVCLGR
jgi:hypothetical protein